MNNVDSEIIIENTEQEEEIYVDYDIATYPSDNTLSVLNKMWSESDIQIPDFQRSFVWSIKQASLLIESFLRGLPVPPIFFFIDTDNINLVVDGQQRLMSIIYFYEGYFGPPNKTGRRQVFKLSGLNDKSRYSGASYKSLSELDRRKLDNSVLRAINIRQLSPSADRSSVYHIFERLNTGGTPLSAQEIRNTVYRGEIVKSLRFANTNEHWRLILGKPDLDKREKDTEILLRLLGLYVSYQEYETPMKRFLNNTMADNRPALSKRAVRFFKVFPQVSEFIVENLGPRPFSPKGPLNVAILDAVFVAVSRHWPKKPLNLKAKVNRLLASENFVDLTSSRTADTDIVRKRLHAADRRIYP